MIPSLIFDNPIIHYQSIPRPLRHASRAIQLLIVFGIIFVSVLLSLGIAFLSTSTAVTLELTVMISWVWAAVVIFMVPTFASRSVVGDRLQGTWDALVISRMHPLEIIIGKLSTAVLALWLTGLLLMPLTLMAITRLITEPYPVPYDVMSPLTALALPYLTVFIGGYCAATISTLMSLRFATIQAALLSSYVLILIVAMLAMVLFSGVYACMRDMSVTGRLAVTTVVIFIIASAALAATVCGFMTLDIVQREGWEGLES
jgi:hypothetical protein